MSFCRGLAQYQVIETLNIKKEARCCLESLLKKEGITPPGLTLLHTEIEGLSREIEILNRALGYYRKPTISVRV